MNSRKSVKRSKERKSMEEKDQEVIDAAPILLSMTNDKPPKYITPQGHHIWDNAAYPRGKRSKVNSTPAPPVNPILPPVNPPRQRLDLNLIPPAEEETPPVNPIPNQKAPQVNPRGQLLEFDSRVEDYVGPPVEKKASPVNPQRQLLECDWWVEEDVGPAVENLADIIGASSRPFTKILTKTDVAGSEGSLYLPKDDVERCLLPILRPKEKEEYHKNGIRVVVYDDNGRKYSMVFKRWPKMVLTTGWNEFRCHHALTAENVEILILMFRHVHTEKLCFAILSRRLEAGEYDSNMEHPKGAKKGETSSLAGQNRIV